MRWPPLSTQAVEARRFVRRADTQVLTYAQPAANWLPLSMHTGPYSAPFLLLHRLISRLALSTMASKDAGRDSLSSNPT